MLAYHGEQLEDPRVNKKNLQRISKSLKIWLKGVHLSAYDVILVGTGVSGVSAAAQLSIISGIPWGFVRKPTDEHHHDSGSCSWNVDRERSHGSRMFILVDDFISSGNTVGTLVRELGADRVLCLVMHSQTILLYDRLNGNQNEYQGFKLFI